MRALVVDANDTVHRLSSARPALVIGRDSPLYRDLPLTVSRQHLELRLESGSLVAYQHGKRPSHIALPRSPSCSRSHRSRMSSPKPLHKGKSAQLPDKSVFYLVKSPENVTVLPHAEQKVKKCRSDRAKFQFKFVVHVQPKEDPGRTRSENSRVAAQTNVSSHSRSLASAQQEPAISITASHLVKRGQPPRQISSSKHRKDRALSPRDPNGSVSPSCIPSESRTRNIHPLLRCTSHGSHAAPRSSRKRKPDFLLVTNPEPCATPEQALFAQSSISSADPPAKPFQGTLRSPTSKGRRRNSSAEVRIASPHPQRRDASRENICVNSDTDAPSRSPKRRKAIELSHESYAQSASGVSAKHKPSATSSSSSSGHASQVPSNLYESDPVFTALPLPHFMPPDLNFSSLCQVGTTSQRSLATTASDCPFPKYVHCRDDPTERFCVMLLPSAHYAANFSNPFLHEMRKLYSRVLASRLANQHTSMSPESVCTFGGGDLHVPLSSYSYLEPSHVTLLADKLRALAERIRASPEHRNVVLSHEHLSLRGASSLESSQHVYLKVKLKLLQALGRKLELWRVAHKPVVSGHVLPLIRDAGPASRLFKLGAGATLQDFPTLSRLFCGSKGALSALALDHIAAIRWSLTLVSRRVDSDPRRTLLRLMSYDLFSTE